MCRNVVEQKGMCEMTKFKKGDRVFYSGDNEKIKGKELVVEYKSSYLTHIYYCVFEDKTYGVHEDALKLITKKCDVDQIEKEYGVKTVLESSEKTEETKPVVDKQVLIGEHELKSLKVRADRATYLEGYVAAMREFALRQ